MAKTYTCDTCGMQSDWDTFSNPNGWLSVRDMSGPRADRHFCSMDCLLLEARSQATKSDELSARDKAWQALSKLGMLVRGLSPWDVTDVVSDRPSPNGWMYDIELTFSPHPDSPDGAAVRRSVTQNELVDRVEHGTLRALAEGIVNDMMLASMQPIATEHKSVRLFYGDQMLATFYPNDTTD